MSKKANIAFFIPHAGCPYQCSFCNQRRISGKQTSPTGAEITAELKKAVAGLAEDRPAEIAFFGGSFTALPVEYMEELLRAAYPFLGQKGIEGIRISTRPDAINREVLTLLKQYGVTAVELGAQCTDDEVLRLNRRGHTAGDIQKAATLIHEFGLELGLQMMTGLYGAARERDLQTARDLIALSPKTVRIYPTVVFPETELYNRYLAGEYTPPSLEETLSLCCELLPMFAQAGIGVIRLGLHGDSSLTGGIGPVHPALRELCLGELFYKAIVKILPSHWKKVTVLVHPTCLSQAVGQKKINQQRLAALGVECCFTGEPTIPKTMVGITREEDSHVPEIFGSTGL